MNPHDPTLAKRFPGIVIPIDIGETSGKMQLFDRLLAHDLTTKVIDLGCGQFAQFFAVMREIDFVTEARQRLIEPVVLFVADPQTATVRTYDELRRQFETTTFLPVHNQAVSITFTKEDFPPTRTEYGVIRVPRLSPLVRRVIDWPNFSFGPYMDEQPDGPTQVHQWICPIVTKFRELELQLLMGRLTALLGGSDPAGAARGLRPISSTRSCASHRLGAAERRVSARPGLWAQLRLEPYPFIISSVAASL